MTLLENGNKSASTKLILAHGAGAPMDSPFMAYFAEQLASDDLHVIRFEFPYMAARRADGKKRPPDRQPKLLESWSEMIERFGPADHVIIGGKSMGGRMASLIADEKRVKGLVCLGYPFHAPGRQDKPRIDHLKDIQTPTLIVQGERDSMGSKDTVAGYVLDDQIHYFWCPDGDHSFKPRKKSGYTEEQNWAAGVEAVKSFFADLS
ncbi:alpha/beta family hydrolase [Sneathiella limimaris]|uniref:alpha/beta family hydrolase n=1 Tax=Sneathiella limimaris TaxID=1964213 RepID=UPI00146C66B8|nr:alpha/beta family hydrolase [Sneathiella limimaris]